MCRKILEIIQRHQKTSTVCTTVYTDMSHKNSIVMLSDSKNSNTITIRIRKKGPTIRNKNTTNKNKTKGRHKGINSPQRYIFWR